MINNKNCYGNQSEKANPRLTDCIIIFVIFHRDAVKNILQNCSVQNCQFTGQDMFLGLADAVVVHVQKGQLPYVERRNLNQRWILLNDESPKHMFTLSNTMPKLYDMEDLFNWTMTYRYTIYACNIFQIISKMIFKNEGLDPSSMDIFCYSFEEFYVLAERKDFHNPQFR